MTSSKDLLKNTSDDNEQDDCNILDFSIFFTHFVKATYTPNRSQLLEFMKRGAAVVCKNLQKGIDLIIPLYCVAKQKESDPLVPENVSYILVSVKNCKSNSEFEDWVSNCDPVYVGVESAHKDIGLPYMVLLLNLRPQDLGDAFIPVDMRMTRSTTLVNAGSARHLKCFPLCLFQRQFNQNIFCGEDVYKTLENMIYDQMDDLEHCWPDLKQQQFVRLVQSLTYEEPVRKEKRRLTKKESSASKRSSKRLEKS